VAAEKEQVEIVVVDLKISRANAEKIKKMAVAAEVDIVVVVAADVAIDNCN
jgi:hypothetical protein